jgi:hypothetical protein
MMIITNPMIGPAIYKFDVCVDPCDSNGFVRRKLGGGEGESGISNIWIGPFSSSLNGIKTTVLGKIDEKVCN